MTTSSQPASIGPYEILSQLAKGQQTSVYLARDTRSGYNVAIKLLNPKAAQLPGAMERLEQDAAAASQLNHPGIVKVLGSSRAEGTAYVAMEYVDGSSLDVLLRQRRLSLQETLETVKQIARVLAYTHGQHVLHLNLKPRNVLIGSDGASVKLSDFGSGRIETVKLEGGTISTGQMSFGLLHYAAPEVAHGLGNVDARADIYSLGVMFYEMLTGRPPSGRVALPSQLVADLPSHLDPIVLRCLAQEPSQRYPSAQALIADIERLENELRLRLVTELEGLSRTTRRLLGSTAADKAAKPAFPLPLVLLGALGLLTVAGVAWLALRGTGSSPPAPPAAVEENQEAEPAKPPAPAAEETKPATETTPPASPAAATETAAAPTGPATRPAEPVSGGQGTRPASSRPSTTAPAPAPAPTPPARPSSGEPAAGNDQADLEVAERKLASKMFDEAESDARAFLAAHPTSPLAGRAALLVAKSQEARGKLADAKSAYLEVASRYPKSPSAPEALYAQARLMLRDRGQEDAARAVLADIAKNYPTSPMAVPALVQKATLEEQKRIKQSDPVLRASAPAALDTYRTLATLFPQAPASEEALWKVAEMYEDARRYDLAAQALADLGSRFPSTRYDAWFKAGELYERKVKDKAKAKAAYASVPSSSPSYREAQDKLRKLG